MVQAACSCDKLSPCYSQNPIARSIHLGRFRTARQFGLFQDFKHRSGSASKVMTTGVGPVPRFEGDADSQRAQVCLIRISIGKRNGVFDVLTRVTNGRHKSRQRCHRMQRVRKYHRPKNHANILYWSADKNGVWGWHSPYILGVIKFRGFSKKKSYHVIEHGQKRRNPSTEKFGRIRRQTNPDYTGFCLHSPYVFCKG